MPQNPTQSRGADDRCIGHGVFGVCCGWVDDGTVQALVVAGDAVSRNHTNHLVIAGIPVTDPDPATMATGYEQGDFDGYAVQATVTDGVLTIAPGAGAFDPTLCFIEIGPEGTTITPDIEARLAELVQSMTTATYAPQAPSLARRQYVFGTYVDELVSYTVGATRYFVHSNHLYSPSAVTNTAGQVQERYRYDAYGKRTVTNAAGTVTLSQSAVGQTRGFTGYILDEETGLYHARARQYDSRLGRFITRDQLNFISGMNLYFPYYVPGSLDPSGHYPEKECCASDMVTDGAGEKCCYDQLTTVEIRAEVPANSVRSRWARVLRGGIPPTGHAFLSGPRLHPGGSDSIGFYPGLGGFLGGGPGEFMDDTFHDYDTAIPFQACPRSLSRIRNRISRDYRSDPFPSYHLGEIQYASWSCQVMRDSGFDVPVNPVPPFPTEPWDIGNSPAASSPGTWPW